MDVNHCLGDFLRAAPHLNVISDDTPDAPRHLDGWVGRAAISFFENRYYLIDCDFHVCLVCLTVKQKYSHFVLKVKCFQKLIIQVYPNQFWDIVKSRGIWYPSDARIYRHKMKEYVNFRLWKQTARLLKQIAAKLGKPITQIVHDFAVQKANELGIK